ncbi:hypothetical protein RHGRI_030291 [Rhododendron griersonianum]|uniref:Uncharacterized protein n=1 Tax=Rhododendron griersonianum TaxID=479676 RepID=A0AAV6INK2_9ERIC|nr:hypothetical protein RHGRI_030291 [Rhododendron griersonianum]
MLIQLYCHPAETAPYVPTEFSLNSVCAGRQRRDKQTPYFEALLLSGESYIFLKVETSAKKLSMLRVTCCLAIYAEAYHKSNQN